MNGRTNSASARTICLLLGALCLVFFLAEMNESNSVTTPGSTSAGGGGGGGGGGAELDVTNGDEGAAEEAAAPAAGFLPGGLRRFGSFQEYVVRAV